MFGRKNKDAAQTNEDVAVSVMPPEFYAGNSPVIQFSQPRQRTAVSSVPAPTRAPVPVVPPTPAAAAVAKTNSFLSNRTFLLGTAVGLFILFVGGASWYYYKQYTAAPATSPVTKLPPPITITPTDTTPVAVVDTSTSTTIVPTTTVPVVLAGGAIVFPPAQLGVSVDSDRDGVPDAEEEQFKTDPQNPDTDGDSYPDALEISNLYSPINSAPATLVDSGLVSIFTNPISHYSVYYPTGWAHDRVTDDYTDMLFSTLTGERVEIRSFDLGSSFDGWFAKWAPTQNFQDLVPFTTRFGFKGFKRSDSLVYYFPTDSQVYVLAYAPGSEQIIHYIATVNMMARSFVPPNTPAVVGAHELEQSAADTSTVPTAAIRTSTTTTSTKRL